MPYPKDLKGLLVEFKRLADQVPLQVQNDSFIDLYWTRDRIDGCLELIYKKVAKGRAFK
jgi:hypothetical protein